jgi:hypothetical protein
VVKALRYKPEGRGFETRSDERFLSIYLIFPAAIDLRVSQALRKMITRSIIIIIIIIIQ